MFNYFKYDNKCSIFIENVRDLALDTFLSNLKMFIHVSKKGGGVRIILDVSELSSIKAALRTSQNDTILNIISWIASADCFAFVRFWLLEFEVS